MSIYLKLVKKDTSVHCWEQSATQLKCSLLKLHRGIPHGGWHERITALSNFIWTISRIVHKYTTWKPQIAAHNAC